jgi:hypothetical protein
MAKALWFFTENRMSVDSRYGWRDDAGDWYRTSARIAQEAAIPSKKPAGEPLIVLFGATARYLMREGIDPSRDGDPW